MVVRRAHFDESNTYSWNKIAKNLQFKDYIIPRKAFGRCVTNVRFKFCLYWYEYNYQGNILNRWCLLLSTLLLTVEDRKSYF